MKSFRMKSFCTLLCAIVFSSILCADFDGGQLVSQSSRPKSKSRNNNAKRDPNTWRPYFMRLCHVEPQLTSFVQQNVGVGFLYFSGIKGNLQDRSVALSLKSNRKLTGHIGYNRTPLTETVIGRDIWRWLKIALSYQHQGGVMIQVRPQILTGNVTPADLNAHVRLDAVMFKTYLMSPRVLVWKGVYHEPYLGLGVGPGWQTWGDIFSNALSGTNYRMKVSANCTFNVDLGLKLRKAVENYALSFTMGCKWNYWGQARSIGKLRDQYRSSAGAGAGGIVGVRPSFFNPPRIKSVYQFAPYLGVQLNF